MLPGTLIRHAQSVETRMHQDFLYAADGTPITKTLRYGNGEWDITPYPFVKLFNSTRHAWNDIHELHSSMAHHAAQGAAMLKGALSQQITQQPRAGLTSPTAHTYLLAGDIDTADAFATTDDLLAALHPTLHDVSYVFHHSAKAGIIDPVGIR